MGGKGSKSSGKGKGGGGWVWMPAPAPVRTPFRSGKGSKKGGKKGGKRGPRTSYSELSEERQEEIRAKHEEKQQELGRETVGNSLFFGELLQRRKSYGWIKPASFAKLPSEVQTKVKEMIKEKRASVKEHDSQNEVFKQNVLFVHMSDVKREMKIQPGDRVKFKVYVDNEGAGCYDVGL